MDLRWFFGLDIVRCTMNLSNYIISLIRTVVPVAVGAAASWLLTKHAFHIAPAILVQVTALLTAAATAGYYSAIRFLEDKFPKGPWGYFLGHTAKPVYLGHKQSAKVHSISSGIGGRT